MRTAKNKIQRLCGRLVQTLRRHSSRIFCRFGQIFSAFGKRVEPIIQKLRGSFSAKCRVFFKDIGRFLSLHRIPMTVFSGLALMTMLMSVITVTVHQVTVLEDGVQVASFYSIPADEQSLLQKSALSLKEGDLVALEENGGRITLSVTRAFPVFVHADGEAVLVMMTSGTVADALKQAGLSRSEQDQLNYTPETPVENDMQIALDRVRNDQVIETVSLSYETKKVNTGDLYVGETKVQAEGAKGEKVNSYSVTYVNGAETKRELCSSTVTKEPENRVILVGTKVKASFKKTASTPTSYRKVVAMTATAYVGGGRTATGRKAEWGVIAVDPSVIPLGTRVYVETADGNYIYGTAVAADIGGAIKGNKIDICVNTASEANSFGRRSVNVYILD